MLSRLVTQLDIRLLAAVQAVPAPARPIMGFASLIGQPLAVTAAVALVTGALSLNHQYPPVWAGGAVTAGILVANVIKLLFRRTRPDTYVPFIWHSYSFPSGHAAASLMGFGLGAWLALGHLPAPWGLMVAATLISLIALVGVSRVYLGAHYPTDVLGGWAAGLGILTIIILVFKP